MIHMHLYYNINLSFSNSFPPRILTSLRKLVALVHQTFPPTRVKISQAITGLPVVALEVVTTLLT